MSREFIYIKLSGPTASYRLPTAISGTQLALEAPPYSSLLGMLSYASGREITPKDTRIGYRYTYTGQGMDLETNHRWKRNPTGTYSYDSDTNIRKRQIHYNITLELLLDNLDLFNEIRHPSRQMTFGRSQDLATLEYVRRVNAEEVESGELWGTLLPLEQGKDIPSDGMFYNLPEYFNYDDGKIRRARSIRLFLALDQYKSEVSCPNLWKISDEEEINPVFYLHSWEN